MSSIPSTPQSENRPALLTDKVKGWRGANGLVLTALFATGVLLVLYAFIDPSNYSIFPRCVFHQITGLNCPGCGGQRAVHHLLHGDVSGALHLNALLVALLPVGVWVLLRWSLKFFAGATLPTPFVHTGWIWTLVIVAVAFGVIRNLPGFSWLSP